MLYPLSYEGLAGSLLHPCMAISGLDRVQTATTAPRSAPAMGQRSNATSCSTRLDQWVVSSDLKAGEGPPGDHQGRAEL